MSQDNEKYEDCSGEGGSGDDNNTDTTIINNSSNKDFSGQFNVKKLNQHLTLCLRVNNNSTESNSTSSSNSTTNNCNGDNGNDDTDSFKSLDQSQFEIVMDEYIEIFQQLYK